MIPDNLMREGLVGFDLVDFEIFLENCSSKNLTMKIL